MVPNDDCWQRQLSLTDIEIHQRWNWFMWRKKKHVEPIEERGNRKKIIINKHLESCSIVGCNFTVDWIVIDEVQSSKSFSSIIIGNNWIWKSVWFTDTGHNNHTQITNGDKLLNRSISMCIVFMWKSFLPFFQSSFYLHGLRTYCVVIMCIRTTEHYPDQMILSIQQLLLYLWNDSPILSRNYYVYSVKSIKCSFGSIAIKRNRREDNK